MGGPKLYYGGNNTDTHLKCVGAELGQIFNLQISLVTKDTPSLNYLLNVFFKMFINAQFF